jgi:hypothetical protein
VSACKSCGASVIWVEVRSSGKRMPLCPTPSAHGNVRKLEHGGLADVLNGMELAEARVRKELLFTSHFASCPAAKGHRHT